MVQLTQQVKGERPVSVVRQREDDSGTRLALDHTAIVVVHHGSAARGHDHITRRHHVPRHTRVQRERHRLVRTTVHQRLQRRIRERRLVRIAITIGNAVNQVTVGYRQLVLVDMDLRHRLRHRRDVVCH